MKNTIIKEYEKTMLDISEIIKNYPWEDKNAYTQWLAQCYYFVRHSTRLLGLAAGVTPLGNDNLHMRMVKHISEEFAHDSLVLNDISALNCKIEDFEELDEIKLFYRNQYFGIQNFGPYYLMGYILFLEGLAVAHGPYIYKRILKKFGKPTTSFVCTHVEADPDHLEKAFKQVMNIPKESEHLVIESLKISVRNYFLFMERLTQKYGSVILTA